MRRNQQRDVLADTLDNPVDRIFGQIFETDTVGRFLCLVNDSGHTGTDQGKRRQKTTGGR
ncbi:hypothetical protein [uncultured Roseibium sp.]|uniref:hypothetical protein n=1 Tax=uncultured Roseibium sp. TaxID=1936171 RepID=UPI003217CB91